MVDGVLSSTIFALDFMVMGDRQISLIGLGLMIVGGAVAALLFVSTARTARGRYFLGNCALLLAVGAVAGDADSGPGGDRERLCRQVVAGLGAGAGGLRLRPGVASPRTRSARCLWARQGRAPLAFVPLANLWLIAAPSHEEPRGGQPGRDDGGGCGRRSRRHRPFGPVSRWRAGRSPGERRRPCMAAALLPEQAWVQYLLDRQGVERDDQDFGRQWFCRRPSRGEATSRARRR